jgi:uncharacterized protein YggU (UPF0235/DUF167 family)
VTAPPLALQVSRAGVVVPVHARPRGRRDAVVGVRAGALVVETVAAPQDGAANEAIRRLLATALAVPRADIVITSGAASRHKRFRVAGLDPVTAAHRLARILQAPEEPG